MDSKMVVGSMNYRPREVKILLALRFQRTRARKGEAGSLKVGWLKPGLLMGCYNS